MNLNLVNQPTTATESIRAHRRSALNRRVVELIERAKGGIRAEFEVGLKAHAHLLHLALNEAEALAWESSHPHLVFPTLATEKAEAVSNWNAHQRTVRAMNRNRTLAA